MDLFREKHTPQSVGCFRGQVRPRKALWLAFMGWVLSQINEWEDYLNNLREEGKISRNWATAHILVFDS